MQPSTSKATVAKIFNWEAAHRIPWHTGKCKNLHGHSYKMIVELQGMTNDNGIVVDFAEIKQIIEPYINQLDHATIIDNRDEELREIFVSKGWKYFILPNYSTAENLCNYFLTILREHHQQFFIDNKIESVSVKIFETDTAYAFSTMKL